MKIKTKIKVSTGLVWIGAMLAVLTRYIDTWCLYVGLGIVAVGVIYRYTMIRCPHCGYKLIEGKEAPAKCPGCGESLE